MADAEMPRYQCHKKVWALRIKDVSGCTITPDDDRYAPFDVDPKLVSRYTPTAGDYYVMGVGGHESFSPAKVFEEDYSCVWKPTMVNGRAGLSC